MTTLQEKLGDYKKRQREAEATEPQIGVAVPFTVREQAELESEIWALVPADARGGDGMGPWLARELGGMRLHYEHRSALLGAGEATDPIWPRLDADMGVATGMELVRAAKKLAPGSAGPKLRQVVTEVLRDYDARPTTRVLPSGKIVKQRNVTRLPSKHDGAKRPDREGYTFWTRLRPILGEYLQGRLGDIDPVMGEELYREFERDLNGLCEEYQSKIDRVRRKGTLVFSVSRRQVIEASAALAMDPPPPGGSVDLVVARRQQRRQAKLYHPDAHAGDVSMRAQYESVMHAYQILEQYQTNIGTKNSNTKRSDDDGNSRGNHHG